MKRKWIMLAYALMQVVLSGMGGNAWGVSPNDREISDAAQWAAAKFGAVIQKQTNAPGLYVIANHDPVFLNARGGRPLNLAGNPHTRGIYCHANSRILVRLPDAGGEFTAVVGVDSNEQTSGGRGSVRFAVLVNDREVFKTPVLKEGMPEASVKVALAGAREFVLVIDDGGDGISCDQSDWAEARVALKNGREIWLGEMALMDGQAGAEIGVEPPFGFTYGGRQFSDGIKDWKVDRQRRDMDAARVETTVTWQDGTSGLQLRCVAVEYRDFPTVEWTLYLKNNGRENSPIISDFRACDLIVKRSGHAEYLLHHFVGSPCQANDFEPLESVLKPGAKRRIAAAGGRPSNSDMPYFNLQWYQQGLIMAVGWPGQWAAEFIRDNGNGLRFVAGQEKTHFSLRPGEEVRSPLMALQFWRGDWVRAQNIWRRWMLAHNVPRLEGKLPPIHMAACSSHQFGEMIHASTENQKLFVDRYLDERLPLDYWWMDAGWYPCDGNWTKTGTWEVDTRRFPGGLRAITDHAHAKGVKSIVWFEPERVHSGTWLSTQHPEWILGGTNGGILNLGNADARQWLTEHVDKLIVGQGIDLYRQDFNIDPLEFWQKNDAADRQGITENHHVTGYLAYWDELRRRHPGMLIDSCASGGRRNDLETMRRAIPLLRSDYIMEPVGNQGHTYGLSFWLPFQGTGSGSGLLTSYQLRSTMVTHFNACMDVRNKNIPYETARRILGQWRAYAENYLGDYYPLTPYSLDSSQWIAWQFDRPEKGEGLVQAFRRDKSIYETARFKLSGLDGAAQYEVTDIDSKEVRVIGGRELMEKGLSVTVNAQPGDVVVRYARKK